MMMMVVEEEVVVTIMAVVEVPVITTTMSFSTVLGRYKTDIYIYVILYTMYTNIHTY